MKNIILTVLFSLIACTSTTFAVSMETELTPKNLLDQRFSFEVKFTKNKLINFRILISKKDTNLSSRLYGYLTVFSSNTQIASCQIQGFQGDQTVSYEFAISPDYIKNSEFTFGNMAGSVSHPMPAGDFYIFSLDKFINAAE